MDRNDGLDDVIEHVLANLLLIHIGGVLGRNNDRINAHWLPMLILHRNLTLAIGTQVSHRAIATPRFSPHLRKLAYEFVGQADRHRHIFGSLVTGEANHHALITATDPFRLIVTQLPYPNLHL